MTEGERRAQLVHAYAMEECERLGKSTVEHFYDAWCITKEERDLFLDLARRHQICPYESYWRTLAEHLMFCWRCDHPEPEGRRWTFTTQKPIDLVLSS